MARCGAPCLNGAPCKALCKKGLDRCYRHVIGGVKNPAPAPANKKQQQSSKAVDAVETCSICWDNLPPGKNKTATLECNHQFCTRCITDWINQYKKTCPMCRGHISTPRIFSITGKMPPVRPPEQQPLMNPLLIQALAQPLPPLPPLQTMPPLPPLADVANQLPALPNYAVPGDTNRFIREMTALVDNLFVAPRMAYLNSMF